MENTFATNTLVRHKKMKWKGIGCISKVQKYNLKVNFGLEDKPLACKPEELEVVDTSKCKVVKFSSLKSMSAVNSSKTPNYVIIGNEVKHYVGIGWVAMRVVTEEDLKKYPRVIE